MRDPGRIDKFYNEFKKVHKESFPDWRFGQLVINFLGWLGRDPFFLEEDEMLGYLKRFARGDKNP